MSSMTKQERVYLRVFSAVVGTFQVLTLVLSGVIAGGTVYSIANRWTLLQSIFFTFGAIAFVVYGRKVYWLLERAYWRKVQQMLNNNPNMS